MIIKVCGITDSTQFNWLAHKGIEMIGLNFYPKSKRYVDQSLVGISSSTKVKKVGVFVNPELAFLLDKVAEHNLALVQLHGDESAEFCEVVANNVPIIKAFGVDKGFSFAGTQAYLDTAEYFLFDTRTVGYGGSGKKFNWHKLAEYQFDKPFLLSGGIQLEDIPEITSLPFPALKGIDINSGFEISPGNKDLDKIYTLLKLTEDDES